VKIGLIGINRYAKFLNFACDLHIYAFQQFLTQNGYESTILDYKPVAYGNFDMRHPADYTEARYRETVMRKARTAKEIAARNKDLKKWADLAVGYRSASAERARRYDKFEAFIDEHLDFTEAVYDSDLLEVDDPGFDAYMCVTDVIWQSVPRHLFDRGFLLGSKAFEGKPKISYAASRGAAKDFTSIEKKAFFDYMKDIDAISIRERDFGEYIEKNSPYEAPTVLDPTLLHGKEFWEKVATKPREERFVLLYYVMEGSADTIQKAVEYAKLHDLTLVELSDRPFKYGKVDDPDVKHVSRYDVGMEEWLGYIQHAEAVFTNSFHGCCFSVLFEKTFFVGNRNGQKVPNFLATFELSDRRFPLDVDVSTLPHEIDYVKVNRILDERRQQSADFVLTALKKAEEGLASGQPRDTSAHDAKRRSITYPARYHSGMATAGVTVAPAGADRVDVKKVASGATEYDRVGVTYRNDGTAVIAPALFQVPGVRFLGWNMRFRIDNRWFWYLADGTYAVEGAEALGRTPHAEDERALLPDGATLPHLAVNQVSMVVFEAQWEGGADALKKATGSALGVEARPTRQEKKAAAAEAGPSFAQRAVRKIKRTLGGSS